MKKIISLKWKIFLSLMVFAIALIGCLWAFQINLLQPMYEKYKVNTIVSAAKQIESAIHREDLTDVIYEVAARNEACVRIINENGQIVAGNIGCDLYRMSRSEVLEQVQLAEENNNAYLYESAMTGSRSSIKNILYTTIISEDNSRNIIMISTGISPVNATTQTLRKQLKYISIFLIIVLSLLTLFLYHTVVKPLIAITTEAKKLSSGRYITPLKERPYQEIVDLNMTLEQAARDIEKADKAKRDLIANVSHDLRTPLTMIRGYGEMMRDLPGEKTDENIQVIIDEATRLNNLVNDLLDLSKLQEKQIHLNFANFNLNQVIQREVKKYDVLDQKNGFDIQLDFHDNCYVFADQERICQVLHNFITNAMNYSREDKRIIIRVKKELEFACVEIQDFGEGIESDKLPLIWERYYKVDKSHKRSSAGSGIGLSIVKEILTLHDVPFSVTSELNQGSTFSFCLRLSEYQ